MKQKMSRQTRSRIAFAVAAISCRHLAARNRRNDRQNQTGGNFVLCLLTCFFACFVFQKVAVSQSIGVNLAGGEFGRAPGVFNKDHTYPGAEQFDYCQKKGLRLIRLPFKWERIQPTLMRSLDGGELARLDAVVSLARQRKLKLVLDMHNYARYGGKLIGTVDVPNAAFADAWKRLASHYRDETAIAA